MKLYAQTYISPILTEGTFTDVYIEEKQFTIEKARKYMSITFEMYYIKDNNKVTLDERIIAFYGDTGSSITSGDAAYISIPNTEYNSQITTIPLKITIPNPNYNSEDVMSPQTIEIDNPDYDNQVASVSKTIDVSLLQYLSENNGEMPSNYEVTNWGYPNFDTASMFFSGGNISSPDIELTNPFAKEWLKNTLVMKNEKVGVQFDFIE